MVFVVIIVFYKFKPHKETGMSKVGNESLYNVQVEEPKQPEGSNFYYDETGEKIETKNVVIEEPKTTEMSIDERFGILEIDYTDEGFKPRVTKAMQGQAVMWTNKTDKIIYFHQRKQTYSALKELVEIKPGGSFNFRLSELGIWTYDENESKHFGSIEVVRVPEAQPQLEE